MADMSLGYHEIPMPQVLAGRIYSMFSTYETILGNCYFHHKQVSFPNDTLKKDYISALRKTVVKPLLETLFQSKQANEMEERVDISLAQMELADIYQAFFSKGACSQKNVWTALFFTYDDGWHYWGATLKVATAHLAIYVRQFERSSNKNPMLGDIFTASQNALEQEGRKCGWDTQLHRYVEGYDPAIDNAFGWTQIWGE
jgi:hypothetical protein